MKFKLVFLGLLICSSGYAQNFFMEKKLADNYFSNFDFHKAIPFYESLARRHPQDSILFEKLATIYDHLNDSKNAERCYEVLVGLNHPKPEFLLNYAKALARNGKYDQSILFYKKFAMAKPEDPRGVTFAGAYENIGQFFTDTISFSIKKEPFSSDADDFSPAYYDHSIIFASDRTPFSMVRSQYNWTQSPYLDLFLATPGKPEASIFARELNSTYHEGPVTFNKTQDTIIFTRSNYYRSKLHKSTEGVNKLSLFQAVWDKVNHKWTKITPLVLNNDQYSVEHPALSPDGNELFFASDMPGGLGGMDIYVAHKTIDSNGKMSWGKPENLGPGINSPGYEVFPFVDLEGNLWYASNGIPGLGGLDIFFAAKTEDGFAKTINPGYPMNTRFDDFGFITDSAGEHGYFSSDRNNSYKNDDIYSIHRPFRNILIWVVDARTGKGLPSSLMGIKESGASPKVLENKDPVPVLMKINPYKSYEFSGAKTSYKPLALALTNEELQKTDTLLIPLTQAGPTITIVGTVVSAVDNSPISGVTIAMNDQTNSSKFNTLSNQYGSFTRQIPPESTYLIRPDIPAGKQCDGKSVVVSARGIQRDTTIQVVIPMYCEGDIIRLENILYDLDKYNIRPDAAKILDKLFALMHEYPKLKIELRSHTDSRASAAYNLKLSDNRAKSAAEYLFSKGIARNRIVGKGYGESLLINQCADGVKCSEAEHQLNRRTEIKILTIN